MGGGAQLSPPPRFSHSLLPPPKKKGWTEARALWSPKGTYLATMHKQGIALWGLPKFERLARFGHTGVRTVQFSPCERFIVTQALSNPEKTVIVWNVETQKECRSFAIPLDKEDNSPVFQCVVFSPLAGFKCLLASLLSHPHFVNSPSPPHVRAPFAPLPPPLL